MATEGRPQGGGAARARPQAAQCLSRRARARHPHGAAEQRADFLAAATGARSRPRRSSCRRASARDGRSGAGRLHRFEEGRQRGRAQPRAAPPAGVVRRRPHWPAAGHDYVLIGRRAALIAAFALRRAPAARRRCVNRSRAAARARRPASAGSPNVAMTDQKNTHPRHRAVGVVLIGWQYFFGMPQMEKQRQQAQQHSSGASAAAAAAGGAARRGTPARPAPPGPAPGAPGQPARGRPRGALASLAARRASRRRGSPARSRSRAGASTTCARKYRETVDPKSPADRAALAVGQPHPFYAEFGWVAAAGPTLKLPGADTVWTAGRRHARRRPAGHADLGQRRRARVPPHHRGRRQIPVHHPRRGREPGRRAGDALSLRADLAPRHAADRSATTSCTRA